MISGRAAAAFPRGRLAQPAGRRSAGRRRADVDQHGPGLDPRPAQVHPQLEEGCRGRPDVDGTFGPRRGSDVPATSGLAARDAAKPPRFRRRATRPSPYDTPPGYGTFQRTESIHVDGPARGESRHAPTARHGSPRGDAPGTTSRRTLPRTPPPFGGEAALRAVTREIVESELVRSSIRPVELA